MVIKTAEELFQLLDGFLEMLKKGRVKLVDFVKKVFEAIKVWLEELVGIKIIDIQGSGRCFT